MPTIDNRSIARGYGYLGLGMHDFTSSSHSAPGIVQRDCGFAERREFTIILEHILGHFNFLPFSWMHQGDMRSKRLLVDHVDVRVLHHSTKADFHIVFVATGSTQLPCFSYRYAARANFTLAFELTYICCIVDNTVCIPWEEIGQSPQLVILRDLHALSLLLVQVSSNMQQM